MKIAHSKTRLPLAADADTLSVLDEVRSRTPGSQRLPYGVPPLFTSDAGNFLALLANSRSNAIAENLLKLAACYAPRTPFTALQTYLGIERFVGDSNRSDHTPFWQAGIPAVMWTDTSEFRNPHYHLASDTPDTLDYDFMADVARVALARVIAQDFWRPLKTRQG